MSRSCSTNGTITSNAIAFIRSGRFRVTTATSGTGRSTRTKLTQRNVVPEGSGGEAVQQRGQYLFGAPLRGLRIAGAGHRERRLDQSPQEGVRELSGRQRLD